MSGLITKFAVPTDQCVGFVVLRLNCARNRLGIVEVLRVKLYNTLSVPGKSSSFIRIKRQLQRLSYTGAKYHGMNEALPGVPIPLFP